VLQQPDAERFWKNPTM